ncbi:MAG TPA: tetratricopeptide repeat protein [Gemmataceae bacterium]|nr:tetratricopeptide repeat protein [Gemmataceae bacterium]
MRRLLAGFVLAAIAFCLAFTTSLTPAADPPDNPRVKATREKMLPAKLKLDIDKKMLRAIISDDLPAAVKEATGLTLKIDPDPKGVTLTSSFGPFKGEMTLEEVLNKICEEKSWGWYVNVGPATDQKNGAIFLTTNPKERGYKEGTGPGGKEVAKKEEPKAKDKAKEKPKDEPKVGDADRAAADLLTKAKLQLNLKQPEKAKATLNEIIEKYPDTKSATEAKKLLEKIGQ